MCEPEKRADSSATTGTPDEAGSGHEHQHVADFFGASQDGCHRDTTPVDVLLVQRLFTSHPLPMLVYDVAQLTVLDAIPISLGPEHADRGHGDWRESRCGAVRRGALEREVAHLALDDPWVVTRAA